MVTNTLSINGLGLSHVQVCPGGIIPKK